jgi:hypothetical protein
MAVGVLRDGSPVIACGCDDGTVRVWRLADSTPLAHRLDLSEPAWVVALHGKIIVTAGDWDIAITSQPLHDPYEIASCSAAPADRHDHRIMAGYPVHRRADASTAMLMACDGHTSTRSPARPVRQRWLCRPSIQADDNSRHGHWPLQRANIRRARQPDIRCITPITGGSCR